MNKISSIIAIMLLSISALFAQVPDAINFQAIARDAGGEVMSNTDIMIRLTVLDGSATGTEVYQELRALTTNEYGSFAFQIGRDAEYVTIGEFSDIIWETGNIFLKIDYDPTNQFNWELTLGTIEFVTVPYAFASNSVTYIDMTRVQNGDILIYNSATEKFEPGQMTVGVSIWEQNSDDIYFNNGNVGIGTSIPNCLLSIEKSNGTASSLFSLKETDETYDFIGIGGASNYQGNAHIIFGGYRNSVGEVIPSGNYAAMINQDMWRLMFIVTDDLTQGTPIDINEEIKMEIKANGNVGIGTSEPTSKFQVIGLPEYADNAAAIAGGLTIGAFYRTGDLLKVVH